MKIRILSFILFLSFMGCGPMNKKPEDSSANSPSSLGSSGLTRFSKDNQFLVYVESASKPTWGENIYRFRFKYSKNLAKTSAQTITVQYDMPTMPSMGTSEEIATYNPEDDFFTTTLFFTMSGRWQITLKLEDGALQDEYTFEISF
ncbi:MAG: hypothetical protein A2Z91_06580 [Deltaproteobacteria bacterium GWA2_38_16]|nr:MAG: hypothetical protein A2Z91_06580 [Deltaproteobacteria bacterium GWA2_38_16]OGQ03421.1 MAG: hypothetical protein A3D19_04830 [Deltaproteobacteria bacterium RIFCSPHIGHO2_02_FULL_38_15]OGQ30094.1 MAG: hypothetical protein A3A72_06905 [Deltaproteobacteria bacterium RIFCSPLOWO2_01_FULL_38_9]HBQ21370.1 hypothetical protein [Deltaproteobacteria bacterium]